MRSALRVAADLRVAANWIEQDHGGVAVEPTDNPIPPTNPVR